MKKVLLILLIIFVVVIAGLFTMCQWAQSELKPHVDMLMTDSNRGRYEQAYERTSKAFRASTTLVAFRGFLEARRQAFGDYVEISQVTGFGTHISDDSGTQGTLKLDMVFEKGTYPTEFTFVKEGSDWKLLNMKIEIPAEAPPSDAPPADSPAESSPPDPTAEKSDPGGG